MQTSVHILCRRLFFVFGFTEKIKILPSGIDKTGNIIYNKRIRRVDGQALSAVGTGSCPADEGISAVRLSHPAAG